MRCLGKAHSRAEFELMSKKLILAWDKEIVARTTSQWNRGLVTMINQILKLIK
jgi:hypothetical protein